MNATSPKLSLAKLGLYPKPKTLKVMILGQAGVGKSAMVVRFITKRYIGEYDPTLEKIYSFHTVIDNEMVYFEILDTAGQPPEYECCGLEANIRWAEAFILMYSVTDKCSFDECYRLKFLINYNKRKKRITTSTKDPLSDVPVVLVGNKTDQVEDRMVTLEDGQKRSKEIGCVCFHEISVRESIEQVWNVFRDTCIFWRVLGKNPSKLKRSGSDKDPESPDSNKLLCSVAVSPSSLIPYSCRPSGILGRRWTEVELEEEDELKNNSATTNGDSAPFRERASTDGHLHHKSWRWRHRPGTSVNSNEAVMFKSERRMSISMRGTNASY
ncbi:ras-like protein 3 [Sitophilus oryzae]|uniref:small monomeric GTPase n=1 Tax=Sitophilus oryzae TaxID=7048 RepID=A0A6J2XY92_SITOR|nr:ras-like protein 3 [Sitophilus oryzae]XP_030755727.1 ras-like protein 3 [Sitophilus oryzae]